MGATITISKCQHDDHSTCESCDVRQASVCSAMQPDELSEFGHLAHPRHYLPRQTLFVDGEEADYVYNVRAGVIRLSQVLADGRRQILGFVLPGDFLGLALPSRFDFTAETIGEVEACRFERKAFVAYVETKPHLLRRLHVATANELALGREQMVLLGRRTAEERIAAFLLSLRRRYRRTSTCDVTLRLPMTRQDIADYCGLTLETVSRTFSKLARDKTICLIPDGVRLVMLDRLQAMVS